MTSTVHELPERSTSRLIAAETRAEMARQGINQTELARRMHVSQAWTSRRLSPTADVHLSFEDVDQIAEALNVPVQRLVAVWLPRLDSNQQPSGYPSAQVNGQVIDLAEARIRIGRAA